MIFPWIARLCDYAILVKNLCSKEKKWQAPTWGLVFSEAILQIELWNFNSSHHSIFCKDYLLLEISFVGIECTLRIYR